MVRIEPYISGTLQALTQDGRARITGTIVLNSPTENETAVTINYTTNKAAGNDTGLLVNQIDTGSPGTSLLLNLQKDGVTKCYIDNAGSAVFASQVTAVSLAATDAVACARMYSSSNDITLFLQVRNFTVSDNSIEMAYGTFSGAGVTQNAVVIKPTWNQTTTSAGCDLSISRTETGVGSGQQSFIEMGTAALGVLTRFRNDGVYFPRQAATASAPTYVEGGIYYDTTLHALRVGGAAGWETVTSV